MGGKKTVKRYLKSEQTDKQTNRQTDIWTFRLIERIGPEGRCFENFYLDTKIYFPELKFLVRYVEVSAENNLFPFL